VLSNPAKEISTGLTSATVLVASSHPTINKSAENKIEVIVFMIVLISPLTPEGGIVRS
jgi:hypothetical protein